MTVIRLWDRRVAVIVAWIRYFYDNLMQWYHSDIFFKSFFTQLKLRLSHISVIFTSNAAKGLQRKTSHYQAQKEEFRKVMKLFVSRSMKGWKKKIKFSLTEWN